jgi:integrase
MQAYKTSQGNWQVNFSEKGRQKTLYLGRDFTAASADRVARIVSDILLCRKRGDALPAEVLQKIKSLPDRIRKSVERLGLVGCVSNRTLEHLLQAFYESKKHLKQKTQTNYKTIGCSLSSFFGQHHDIAAIGKMDCERLVNHQLKHFTACSLSRAVRHCRTIFRFAIDLGWIEKNPFDVKVKRIDVNLDRQEYVDRETVCKVMECCRDDYDRLLLALARFGGLRIPSELLLLRYEDFTDHVIRIHKDTKTGAREVPLFGEIREIFSRLVNLGKEPTDYIFDHLGNFRKRIVSAIAISGVEQWQKLFLNLRSSCITDCVELGYSEKMLDSMFGNSAAVRSQHYIQFRKDREYAKALLENERLQKLRNENNEKEALTESELDELLMLRKLLVGRFGIGKKAG